MLHGESGERQLTAKERGEKLKQLLKDRSLTQDTFADATKQFDPEGKGLNRITIARLCNGTVAKSKKVGGEPYIYDLLNVYEETASCIILTLDHFKPISDTEVQKTLGLDTDPIARTIWRTARPWPMGIGAIENQIQTFSEKLKAPLRSPLGDLVLPAGVVIVVDPLSDKGYQLYKMEDGSIYALKDSTLNIKGKFMGRLKQVVLED